MMTESLTNVISHQFYIFIFSSTDGLLDPNLMKNCLLYKRTQSS